MWHDHLRGFETMGEAMRAVRRGAWFVTAALVSVAALLPAPLAATGGGVIEPKIIGGGIVDAATVPWTVALLHKSQPDAYAAQFCGGSLIDQRWILTAAHCVAGESASTLDVAWGITDLYAVTTGDRHALSRVISHPGYNPTTMRYDVALLELAIPVPGAATIPVSADPSLPPLGEPLDTYGWGNTMYPGTSYPNELHGVALTDMSGPSGGCGSYGADYLSEHMLCAGISGGGKDACDGDSGGPIVATTVSGPVLVGATSWGVGCALGAYPGIWSRLSSFEDWVNQQINPSPPVLSVGDVSLVEGDKGTRRAKLAVTLSPESSSTVTVKYATVDASAQAPSDYSAKSGTVTFKPGQTSKTVSVAVRSDTLVEGDQSFTVSLSTPTNAVIGDGSGLGTIRDDDPHSGVQLTIGDAFATEGDSGKVAVSLTVSLSRPSTSTVTVAYQTVNGTAGRSDFTSRSGTLTFASGQVSKILKLSITSEWLPELTESFTVNLGSPTGDAILTDGIGTVVIADDD